MLRPASCVPANILRAYCFCCAVCCARCTDQAGAAVLRDTSVWAVGERRTESTLLVGELRTPCSREERGQGRHKKWVYYYNNCYIQCHHHAQQMFNMMYYIVQCFCVDTADRI